MARETRQVIAYFGLVTVLTLPIWLMGQLFPLNPLPGLPIAAAAVLCPAQAALCLAYRSGDGRVSPSLAPHCRSERNA